jgi:spermidine/putrescine-binding protein
MGGTSPRKEIPRRTFIKYGVIGGLAAWGAYSGLVYGSGWNRWLEFGQKPWEVALGVVDYDRVAQHEGSMDQNGVPEIYRTDPQMRILNVAQWYDYWPGSVIRDFGTYMKERFNLDGCAARWTSNIYTSNEELFTWVTQTGRKFDVMVPTNYTVETMEKAGLVINLNKDWLPNYKCIFGLVPLDISDIRPWHPQFLAVDAYPSYSTSNGTYNNMAGFDFRTPALNGYQYRMNSGTYPNPRGTDHFTWDDKNSLLAVPYQWGTTGIGYRSDIFARQDIERLGWDVFELSTYANSVTGNTYNLNKKKMMLDDMREVFTAALKAVGWKKQVEAGLSPTPQVGAQGEFQWSSNEIDETKIQAAQDWLLSWRGSSWGFNTPQQGPWLVSGERWVDHAWSGDVMYAVRPNSSQFLPVDYFVPKQGGARWIDNLTIHRESEKLWLAHQFINYIHDPIVQADISEWNLYATPNAWSFELLHQDPTYSYRGRDPNGRPYYWNPAEDYRIYSDFAPSGLPGPDGILGTADDESSNIAREYTASGRPPILNRCEYQKDVGVRKTLQYFKYWRSVKF